MSKRLSGLGYWLVALLALVVVGCGGSNDFTQMSGQQSANNGLTFVGQFLGANNVTNNQTGTLTVNTMANGTATGTLQVAAVNPQTNVPVGSYDLSGSFDPATGTFNLSGNIPPIGPFTVSGTFPTGSNAGTYNFTFNGQTFAGAIQAASQGVPTVPNNNNNNNNGGNSNVFAGGTLSNFVFTPDGNYNGVNPPVDANSLISGAFGPGQNNESTLTFVLSETELMGQTALVRSLAITVVDPSGNPIEAGNTYNLATDTQTAGTVIALSESVGTTVQEGWSLVQATTGSVTIVAVDENSVTIDFTFSNVGPNSEIPNNPSTGSFDISGRLLGNFANLP